METPKAKQDEKVLTENEGSLKGTIFSVGVVGAVIFLTYLLLYGLYMARV